MSHLSFKALACASLLAAVAFGTSSHEASAKSVTACKAGTRQGAIACCEDIVRRKGLPAWMKKSHKECGSAAVCVGSGGSVVGTLAAAPAKMKCYIKYYHPTDNNNNNGPKGKGGRGSLK